MFYNLQSLNCEYKYGFSLILHICRIILLKRIRLVLFNISYLLSTYSIVSFSLKAQQQLVTVVFSKCYPISIDLLGTIFSGGLIEMDYGI